MINLSPEIIKKLKTNSEFKIFQEYLLEKIQELDSLGMYDETKDDTTLGEIVRARIIARDMLYKILRPLVDFKEKAEPTKEQIEEAKKKVGL